MRDVPRHDLNACSPAAEPQDHSGNSGQGSDRNFRTMQVTSNTRPFCVEAVAQSMDRQVHPNGTKVLGANPGSGPVSENDVSGVAVLPVCLCSFKVLPKDILAEAL